MILDYPFHTGLNTETFELKVNLDLVGEFHSLAKGQLIENKLKGKSVNQHKDKFFMNLLIEDLVQLQNWIHQVVLFKKRRIDEQHLHNLLYLAKQAVILEKDFMKKEIDDYTALLEDLKNILAIHECLLSDNLTELNLTMFSKSFKLAELKVKDRLPKAILSAIIKPYLGGFLEDWLPFIKHLIGSDTSLETITFDKLYQVKDILTMYIEVNLKRSFKYFVHDTIFSYIKKFDPFNIHEGSLVEWKPNNSEARLTYLILCLAGESKVLIPTDKEGTHRKLKGLDYPDFNDKIMQRIGKVFTDTPTFYAKNKPFLNFTSADYIPVIKLIRTSTSA